MPNTPSTTYFEVGQGEIFGLLGPNGAGKTTTIRMLSCIIAPTRGNATVAGYDITKDQHKIRQSVGILTENPSLYEKLSARLVLHILGLILAQIGGALVFGPTMRILLICGFVGLDVTAFYLGVKLFRREEILTKSI